MSRLVVWVLSVAAAFAQTAAVTVDLTRPINSFDPDSALGSSIDVLSKTGIDKVYTPHIIQESLSAGWGPITYRNNSELRMTAWHWTENGAWSDAAHKSGYFTGSSELKEPIKYILQYSRSEEHTSELQSHVNLVCRLLLEKKKTKRKRT